MTIASPMALALERRPVGSDWWRDPTRITAAAIPNPPLPSKRAAYRFGRALVQVETNEQQLLDSIDETYGECATNAGAETARVRCMVRSVDRSGLVRLDFLAGAPSDPAASALALLHPAPGSSRYAVEPAEQPDWRLIGETDRPLIAASADCVLADRHQVPEDFLADYLVAATLETQPDLVVVHAAALNVRGRGILLIGASRAGKTTTAMHLAALGHSLLGDEIGLLDLSNRQVLALRRTVHLRTGPRGQSFATALQRAGVVEAAAAGSRTEALRIDRVFPATAAIPAPLCAMFFFCAFGAEPRIQPFQPTLSDADLFEAMSANDIALISWGLEPAGRTLRLLALRYTLRRVPCWRMTVGSPDATAQLVERTLEGL